MKKLLFQHDTYTNLTTYTYVTYASPIFARSSVSIDWCSAGGYIIHSLCEGREGAQFIQLSGEIRSLDHVYWFSALTDQIHATLITKILL